MQDRESESTQCMPPIYTPPVCKLPATCNYLSSVSDYFISVRVQICNKNYNLCCISYYLFMYAFVYLIYPSSDLYSRCIYFNQSVFKIVEAKAISSELRVTHSLSAITSLSRGSDGAGGSRGTRSTGGTSVTSLTTVSLNRAVNRMSRH